ncbi:HpsJ-like protein, cyanoexosortase A-associated [Pleurocapsa sp. FMAR1]|uniref:HpsJ-like protein, cyanoexosortase A-associated n=1 Tax=Pleurocapsa sp. FMAR1 TaxID=3040204 RepID=UPI0029C8E612|nr:HpsJ family protein [Pleurocapsa sp. FMAR1]
MLKYRLWRIKQSFVARTKTTLEYKRLNIQVERNSTKIINTVGYVIFAVVLLDYAFLLASAQFSDSDWVHSTAGGLVENGWGLLLGFLFIFYRRDQDIVKPKEFFLLKLISWLALVIGISYFLVAPLIIGNAFRINRNSKAQMIAQIDAANTQVEQYSTQLEKATPEQLASVLKNYQSNSPELEITNRQQLKENLLTQVQQKQNQAKKELQTQFTLQKKKLFKITVKWSMTAIMTGMCFILIWKYTTWARVGY